MPGSVCHTLLVGFLCPNPSLIHRERNCFQEEVNRPCRTHPELESSQDLPPDSPQRHRAELKLEARARGQSRAAKRRPGSPFAKPRGLKDAVGVTVLVESMKLREAQNIPERMLVSSFQALSTLGENRYQRLVSSSNPQNNKH